MRIVPAAMLFASLLASAQLPYQPQAASPPRDAGYVMTDGTIRIVGWDDLAGMFANLNFGDPTKRTYVPDFGRPAVQAGSWRNGSLRLTVQATPRKHE